MKGSNINSNYSVKMANPYNAGYDFELAEWFWQQYRKN
jgi:hypothetical protein